MQLVELELLVKEIMVVLVAHFQEIMAQVAAVVLVQLEQMVRVLQVAQVARD
jgi:hypothetical protein